MADPLEHLAALSEPTRRALYEAVAKAGTSLSRDQAARRAGTTRALAAFHLDRLVEAGLLAAEFRRLTGRSGPGAGRPSKLYRRAAGEVAVSLPPRRYDLAGELLAQAVEADPSPGVKKALARAARRAGRSLGAVQRTKRAAMSALERQGFEPFVDGAGDIRLRNCPFHALAGGHRELVCGMNLELMRGLKAGANMSGYTPVLAPEPGACCVVFRKKE